MSITRKQCDLEKLTAFQQGHRAGRQELLGEIQDLLGITAVQSDIYSLESDVVSTEERLDELEKD